MGFFGQWFGSSKRNINRTFEYQQRSMNAAGLGGVVWLIMILAVIVAVLKLLPHLMELLP